MGTLSRERGRAATQKLERAGYLQGSPSCCHLPWESQPPQSTEIHMLSRVFPALARGSQHFPKGVLQSQCFLHHCGGSLARVQPMPDHTTPPIPSEGRGKQLSSHACYSAPRGAFFSKFKPWAGKPARTSSGHKVFYQLLKGILSCILGKS